MGYHAAGYVVFQPIDPLAAGGLVVAGMWAGKRIVTGDQLGDSFLSTVKNGEKVSVSVSGEVVIRG